MATAHAQPDTSAPPATVAAALRARAVDCADRVFLRAGDATWTFAAAHREACRYANLFLARRGDGPFHVGVLMDNLPAFVFAELGCALAGATLVGLNPTRTGAALARDVEYADCQMVLTETRYADQLRDASGDRLPILLADGPSPSLEAALTQVDDRDPDAADRRRRAPDDRLHLRHDASRRRACSTVRGA